MSEAPNHYEGLGPCIDHGMTKSLHYLIDCIQRDRNSQGERHGMSKLTEDAVRYIRKNYIPKHREFSAVALSLKFGVSPKAIFNCMSGHTWAHVKELHDEK